MIGTSPRRRRRRPPSAATGRIWCGAVTNQILLARGFANQDKKREVLENIRIHVQRRCHQKMLVGYHYDALTTNPASAERANEQATAIDARH
jgi:hypothetical protein